MGGVIGAIIIVVVLVLVIPPLVLMSGGVASGILGFLLQKDRDEAYEGTEHAELS